MGLFGKKKDKKEGKEEKPKKGRLFGDPYIEVE